MARVTANYTYSATAGAGSKTYFKALSDSLIAVNLTRTTDTGQVDWTVSTDGQGYEVFAWSDALQGTAPLLIRTRYVAGAQTGGGGIYATVGTASDGAGNLTGTTCPEMRLSFYSSISAARTLYASHGEGYLTWVFDVDVSNTTTNDLPCLLVVERLRNADGTSSTDGFVTWFIQRASATVSNWQGAYARNRNDATQPALDLDPKIVIPNLGNVSSLFVGSTSMAYPAATFDTKVRGASKALAAGFPADFPRNTEVVMNHYGTTMSYRSYSGLVTIPVPYVTSPSAAAVKSMCPILRWE